jgi:small subunit ribosomal protein S21
VSEVHIKDNESLDSALKRFKRNCAKAGVLSDLRKKEYYQSPSVKRRKKSEAARKKKIKSLSHDE